MKEIAVTVNLEVCPWCGKKPVFVQSPLWSGNLGYQNCYSIHIACKNEECKIQPRTKKYNNVYMASIHDCIDNAVKDWNRRN